MDVEAELIPSLQVKLQESKTTAEWFRNRSRCNFSNRLPPELLSRIFHLALDNHSCAKNYYCGTETRADSVYPIVLSQVCSYWRKVAFSTPVLWAHIDLSTSATLNQLRLNRLAKLHLDLAGGIPLNLHVFDSRKYPMSPFSPCDPLHSLIVQLSGRAYSLNLDAGQDYDCTIHGGILSALFEGAVAGRLATITMSHEDIYHSVIKGKDHISADPEDVRVNLLTEQLEEILSGVVVLHLNRIYPQWNSRAFHGLAELRLRDMYSSVHIKEAEFVGILRLSPRLRILELGVEIDDPLPTNARVTGVPLESLEILDLSGTRCCWHAIILRWLNPGSNPLQFKLYRGTCENLETKISLGPFLSRSNITRVFETGLNLLHILDLLELCPNLQEMVVSWVNACATNPLQIEDTGRISLTRLECLYVTGSSVHVEDIIALMNVPTFTVKTAVFYDCILLHGDIRIPIDQEETQLEELRRSNPDVTCIWWTNVSSPVESWNASNRRDEGHV
ncbi:hypothetical protein RHS03_06736, partial [Rhizoctonia solani]